MTRCTIIGAKTPQPINKPIEFTYCLEGDKTLRKVDSSCTQPHEYEEIELICLNYGEGFDLMYAYEDPDDRGHGSLYLGHWNDGFVAE